MSKEIPLPVLKRILWTDYPAFLAMTIAGVAWIVYLAWAFDWLGRGAIIPAFLVPYVLVFVLLISGVAVLVVAWRISVLRGAFRNGALVNGRISEFRLRGDKSWVEYTYFFQNEPYRIRISLHRNRQTRELHAGERVILVVDRRQPQRAFIRDLYV